VIGHRAIGVVYHPEYEHMGNYVPSNMAQRYDAFIFIDRTTALHPLIVEEVFV
jgi:erythromycin esterase-like protein